MIDPKILPGAKAYAYIRHSTVEQETGDSYNRQSATLEGFTTRYGLPIAQIIYDKKSAYRADHIKTGDFSIYIQMIEDGRIKAGDFLVCESIDRLSREMMIESSQRIIKWLYENKIILYTTIDNTAYFLNKQNEHEHLSVQLRISIIAERAREESNTKSKRLKSSWISRIEKAKDQNYIIIKKGKSIPFGLRVIDGKFVRNEAECAEVEALFTMLLQKGMLASLREINQTSQRKWTNGHLQKMIKSKSIIGYLSTNTINEDGKGKTPRLLNSSIENYYPKIISDDLFWAVFDKLKERKNGEYSGRSSLRNFNIFQHIIFCDVCKKPMFYDHRGASYKDKIYPHFKCETKTTGQICSNNRIRFEYVFKALLNYLYELKTYATLQDGRSEKLNTFLGHSPELTTILSRKITSLVNTDNLLSKSREEAKTQEIKASEARSVFENFKHSFDMEINRVDEKTGKQKGQINSYFVETFNKYDIEYRKAKEDLEIAKARISYNADIESFTLVSICNLFETETGRIKLNNFMKANQLSFYIDHDKLNGSLKVTIQKTVDGKQNRIVKTVKTGKVKQKRIKGEKVKKIDILSDIQYMDENEVMVKLNFDIEKILNEAVHISPNQMINRYISGKNRKAYIKNDR